MLAGHTYEGLTYSAKGTNVGEYDGVFSGDVVIKDGDVDVTQNYAITKTPGKLEITKASIAVTFTGESDTRTYTGSEQELTGITPSGLLAGHTYEGLTYSAKGTNVGEYDGVFSGDVVIKDGDVDVTQNYVITKTPGKLEITKASIAVTFTGESDTRTYTGSEQELTGITPSGLLAGHTYEGLTYSAKGTNVGEYDGVFSGDVVIKDGDVDVTQNYAITKTPGKLEITKASIAVTFTGESDTRTYTGSEQELTGITPSGLLAGHTYEGLTYSAKGTNVGEYDGVFSGDVVIKDGDVDVTQNYAITKTPGKLEITKASIAVTFTGESDTRTYTGSEQELTGITPSGLLAGHTYEGLTYSAKGTNVGEYDGVFSGDVVIKDGDVDVTQNYAITKTPGKLEITKASIAVTFTGESDTRTYTGSEQELTGITPSGLLAGHTYEGLTYSAKGTNVGEYDGVFSGDVVIKDGDVDVTQNYAITKTPGKLEITKASIAVTFTGESDTRTYTGSEQELTGITPSGLLAGHTYEGLTYSAKGTNVGEYDGVFSGDVVIKDGDVDVTQNYAITKTPGKLEITKASIAVTFTGESDTRTYTGSEQELTGITPSGLLAGHTYEGLTYSAKGTNVGEYDGVFSGDVVIKDGDVDVTQNYVITKTPGKLEITKASIAVTFTGESDTRTYTGSEQELTGITPSGLLAGHTYEGLTYSAKGTNVGEYDGVFSGDVVIKDGDVDVTQNYAITKTPGKLEITKASIAVTFTGESDTRTYTGSEQELTGITPSGLLAGHTYEGLTYSAKGTNVGEYDGVFSGDVVIKDGDVDVTQNYVITKTPGKLEITKASIAVTFTGESDTRTYTGSEQELTGITPSGLLAGHTYEGLTYSAKGTNVGEYDGVFSGDVVIKDGDVDVTQNYAITKTPGKLEITKASIAVTFTGESDTRTYTGSEQELTGITPSGLLAGHTYEGLTYSAKGTNVGEYDGVFSGDVVIKDGDVDVTQNYAITKTPGKLEITKASIAVTFTGESDTRTYTGSEQELTGITPSGLLAGHTYEGLTYSAKGTNVGEYDGVFSGDVVIKDGDVDVTQNYAITKTPGKLEITKASIAVTFIGESDTRTYTGSEQELTGITPSGLLAGHTYEGLTYSAKGTNVGEYDGVFSGDVVIKDGDVDVTQNYAITKTPGKLEITKASIAVTFTGESDTRTYTGSEQELTGITPSGLLAGHTYEGLTYSAKGTNVGEYDGVFSGDVVIKDGDVDVTQNYAITKTPGKLEITKASIAVTFTGESDTRTYTGSEQELTGITPSGLLAGHTYEGLTYSAKGTNVGEYDGVFSGDVVIKDGDVDVTQNYVITKTPGKLEITKASIAVTFTGESDTRTYTGSEQELTGITPSGLLAGHTYEGLTYSAKGTNVGEYDGVFSGDVVIKDGDVDVTQNYAITKTPGKLEITKASIAVTFTGESDTRTYTGSEQELTGITPSGLLAGHTYEGLTYSAKGTNVGEYDGVFSGDVVIKDGDVDVTQNYAITKTPGKLEITKASIAVTFTGESDTRTYTGSEQELTGITPSGLLAGHTYEGLTYSAKGTNVGEYDGVFSGDVVIKDGDVDVTQNYAITKTPGKLEITKASIAVTFTGESDTRTYTGSEQELTGITPSGLLAGHTYEGLTYSAKGTNVGEYDGVFSGDVVIKDGDVDVTQNYAITKTPGKLEITKASIAVTFTGESDTRTYTGSEQELTGITPSGLLAGHTYEGLTYSAKGTNVGEYDGVFSGDVVIKDGDVDVTQNYVITKTPGKLEITKASIAVTFTGESDTRTYTGSEQELTGITPSGLLAGHTYEGLTYSAKGTNVGEYDGVFSGDVVIKDGDVDVTQNYVITKTPGKLEITPITTPIVITANSDSKVYDGTPLTNAGYTYTKNVLVDLDVLKAVVEGTITDVGTADNVVTSYKVMRGETDVTGNYTFGESVKGTLTITQDPAIALEKTVDKIKVNAAGDVTYTYTIKNTGDVPLTNLSVTDDKISGAITPLLTELAPGASTTVTATFTITQTMMDEGDPIVNIATASGLAPDRLTTVTSEKATATVEISQEPNMTVEKSADKTSYGTVDEEIKYTVVVTNTGNVTLNNLVLADELMSATPATRASLAVGETWTVEYTHKVTQDDLDKGSIVNAVAVTSDETGEDDPTEDEHEIPADQNPAMTVEKSADKTSFTAVGEEIKYTVVVTNTGNITLNNLVLADELMSATPATRASLAVGDTWTVEYTHKVTQDDLDKGSIVNAVAVTSDETGEDDPTEDEHEIPADQNPAMTVEKSADKTSFTAVGEEIKYTVVVTNTGNITLNNLVLADELMSATPATRASLAVGDTWTVEYTYIVTQRDLAAGKVLNKVSVTKDNPDNPDEPELPPIEDEHVVPGPAFLDIETTINPTKSLTGRALRTGEFTFALRQGGETLQSITNDAEGNILFSPLVYTAEDIGQTYSYTIVEIPGTDANMTYSTTAINFTVSVKDAGDGVLSLTVNAPAAVIFFNIYTPPVPPAPEPIPEPIPEPAPGVPNFDLGVVPSNVADCLE
ncbi:MAG: DUF7507 domain-containing protein [Christensenellales bacterium]